MSDSLLDMLFDDPSDKRVSFDVAVTEEVTAASAINQQAVKADIPKEIVEQAIEMLTNNGYSRVDAEYEVTKIIRSGAGSDKLFSLVEKIATPKKGKAQQSQPADVNNAVLNAKFDYVDDIELKARYYFTVFEPTGRNMKVDYQELASVPEFKDLTNSELVFVWWVANRTSPVFNLPERKKVYVAYKKAFGKVKNDTLQQYLSGIFPAKIALALEKMKTYIPSVRLEAKLMAEKTWEDYRKILSTNIDSITDADAKSKHLNMIQKVRADMPNILRDIEMGYGVTIKEISDEDSKFKDIDILLSQEEEEYNL